jgi:hypothetical protein
LISTTINLLIQKQLTIVSLHHHPPTPLQDRLSVPHPAPVYPGDQNSISSPPVPRTRELDASRNYLLGVAILQTALQESHKVRQWRSLQPKRNVYSTSRRKL